MMQDTLRGLRKTVAMKQVERKFGRPLEVLFPQLFDLYGNTAGVADALGICRNKVYDWARRLGYEVESRARLVPIRAAEEPGGIR